MHQKGNRKVTNKGFHNDSGKTRVLWAPWHIFNREPPLYPNTLCPHYVPFMDLSVCPLTLFKPMYHYESIHKLVNVCEYLLAFCSCALLALIYSLCTVPTLPLPEQET